MENKCQELESFLNRCSKAEHRCTKILDVAYELF